MARELKARINITLSQDNARFLKHLTEKSGVATSLFIDSLLTGVRASFTENSTESEALAMALEQIAKGLRR